jgi:hypothetical protein
MVKKISGSSLENSPVNGLGKTSAALDTLIVAASGYKVTRLGISSYIDTNNFVLPWYGHVGAIAYDQGSYSGCQHTAAVIVNDTDLVGATVSVRVKSRADTVGFTLVLKKDATVLGQYIDSIRFSIKKSDSASHTIKVQQAKDAYGDSIYSIYSDAAPAMKETTMVLWSGNSGEIGPGASMYAGLTTKIAINLTDQDLNDTVAYVTIKAPADTIGILFPLKAVAMATGTYHGELGVSTTGSSQANGVIKVSGKDIVNGENIDIYYQDITPMQLQKGSICTWRPTVGSFLLDSAVYHGTVSKMFVTLYDDDIAADTAVITVKSKKDPTGISRKLAHTGAATDRVFTGLVGFSTTASNAATGVVAVQDSDFVSVGYVDTTPDTTVIQETPWLP